MLFFSSPCLDSRAEVKVYLDMSAHLCINSNAPQCVIYVPSLLFCVVCNH